VFCVHFPAWWTHYLNSVSATGPVWRSHGGRARLSVRLARGMLGSGCSLRLVNLALAEPARGAWDQYEHSPSHKPN
ncbi:MAG: hypothetical protein ACLP8X_37445, partial [Streptosporangiaceae bacterium]